MSDAVPLPPRPSLEQYKKLAKDFHSVCQSGDPGAVRKWSERWVEDIARRQGIAILRRDIDRRAKRMEQRWRAFEKTCRLADAQFFLAREHGFASWPKFARHVAGLAGANSPVSNFEAAADAIVTGDAAAVQKLLHDDPELVRARSTREHRSTLLHYVSANGIEDFRQKTPKNIVAITNLLLDAGADVNAESDAYGGRSTTLGLAATSVHPQRAGVQIALLQTLLDRGAKIGGASMISACLANGQPEAAEFFASLGVPMDLVAAAALGRLDVVQRDLDENNLASEAYLYGCGYGRTDVVAFLLDNGIDPGLQNDEGQTGLHLAAYGAHLDLVRLLLQRGTPIGVKDTHYHATPLDVALWVWNYSDDAPKRERCYQVVALMARAGATLDPEHWRDPADETPGTLGKIQSDPRMLSALRGEISG
jgi:ankyrin repeat protein